MKQRATTTNAHLALTRLLLAATCFAFCLSTVRAQSEDSAEETISVNSRVARVAVVVPPSVGASGLVVRGGSSDKTAFTVDSPQSSPLSLVVLLDMSTPSNKGWRDVGERLARLQKRLGLKEPPTLVVVHPDFPNLPLGQLPVLPFKLPDWGGAAYPLNVRAGFDYAISEVERAKYPRRALLVITDRFADLPAGIFEETDERLANEAALVFLATVRTPKVRLGSPDLTIGRMNLNNYRNVVHRGTDNYLDTVFDYFEQAASEMYVVSFPVSEDELSAAPLYSAEVSAIAQSGRLLNRQSRRIALGQTATFVTHARQFPFDATPTKEPEEPALVAPTPATAPVAQPSPLMPVRSAASPASPSASASAWLDSREFKALADDPSPIFSRIERDPAIRTRDVEGLPEWVRAARVTDGDDVKKVRTALAPLFAAFPGASGLDIFIYRSDAVFVALGERSMIVISTGAVAYFTSQELLSAASHEMAHLWFYERYLDAFVRRDYAALQRIELQCDALGIVLSVRAGARAESLSTAVRRHDQLLKRLGEYDPALVPAYPALAERLAFQSRVRLFLEEGLPRLERAGK